MRSSIVAGLAGLAAIASALPGDELFARAQCNRDNCLRAVAPTPTKAANQADCSSFLARTVTTCAPGVTGCTTTVAPTPTSVPSYASKCSGAARYSSACSCAGITGSTVTVTATPSTTSSPAPSVTAFYLQIGTGPDFEAFNQPVNPVIYASQYQMQAVDAENELFYFTPIAGSSPPSGLVSPVNPANNIYYADGDGSPVFAYAGAEPNIYCSLAANNQFTCASGTTSTQWWEDCNGYISLGEPYDTACQASQLQEINLIYQIAQ